MRKFILGIIFLIFFGFLTYLSINKDMSCFNHDEPLLKVDSYPKNSVASRISSPHPNGPINSFSNSVVFGKGMAIQNVFPYPKTFMAINAFKEEAKAPYFLSIIVDENLQRRIETENFEFSADQYLVSCGTARHNVPVCAIIAQYDNYFIDLYVHMYPDEMTYDDLRKVLHDMDNRMALCLE